MPSTYSANNRLELMADGENATTWGSKTNNNLNLIEQAISGVLTKNVGGNVDVALTTGNGVSDEARNLVHRYTGVLTGNVSVILPTVQRAYLVQNSTTGNFTLTVKTASGTGVVVPRGDVTWVYCDGAGIVPGFAYSIIPYNMTVNGSATFTTGVNLAAGASVGATLSATNVLFTGGSINNVAIGQTTPAAGKFTTVVATSTITATGNINSAGSIGLTAGGSYTTAGAYWAGSTGYRFNSTNAALWRNYGNGDLVLDPDGGALRFSTGSVFMQDASGLLGSGGWALKHDASNTLTLNWNRVFSNGIYLYGNVVIPDNLAVTGTVTTPNVAARNTAKAWVNFDGGSGAIRNNFNVAAVGRNAVGDYTVYFTAALSSANLCAVASAGQGDASHWDQVPAPYAQAPATNSVRVGIRTTSGTTEDLAYVNVVVFGD